MVVCQVLTCEALYAGLASTISYSNALIVTPDGSRLPIGTVATLSCADADAMVAHDTATGYAALSDPTRTCLSDGNWDGAWFTCKVR